MERVGGVGPPADAGKLRRAGAHEVVDTEPVLVAFAQYRRACVPSAMPLVLRDRFDRVDCRAYVAEKRLNQTCNYNYI